MEIVLPKPGSYVIAVSGGVDSMALLHILRQKPELKLIVAHLDHGIRPDSNADKILVEDIALIYGLSFIYEQAKLGPDTSEDIARQARYKFLRSVAKDHAADAIITAHHQDDLLETAILNMLRGTNRKGLTALNSDTIERPLLKISKQELIEYAKAHNLTWHEDNTNNDDKYLRNYIRKHIMPKLNQRQRETFLNLLSNQTRINNELDTLLVKYLSQQSGGGLNRQMFAQLPRDVAREVLASWLREHNIRDFDSKTIDRLLWAGKAAGTGESFPVLNGYNMEVSKYNLALVGPER